MSVSTPTLSPNPWLRILGALEKKINRHSYDTWLKPTRYSHVEHKKIFVRVPTPEFRHIGEKYADLIQEAIEALGLAVDDVEFITPEEQNGHSVAAQAQRLHASGLRADGGLAPAPAHAHSLPARPTQVRFAWDPAPQPNPRYPLNPFVTGTVT